MMVPDLENNEIGQQRRKDSRGRLLHCCCICGKLETWGPTWTTYCKVEFDEGKPIPKFCSSSCKKTGGPRASLVTETMKRIAKDAEWRDPITVYREATDKEKYADAARRQRVAKRAPFDTTS